MKFQRLGALAEGQAGTLLPLVRRRNVDDHQQVAAAGLPVHVEAGPGIFIADVALPALFAEAELRMRRPRKANTRPARL